MSLAQKWLFADVAQLAEHLICNQAVASSILAVSSSFLLSAAENSTPQPVVSLLQTRTIGGVAEWLMAADCKSAGFTPYEGSNPSPTIWCLAGWSGLREVYRSGTRHGHEN